MNHTHRIQLAQELGNKLLAAYGEKILVVLLDGSVARNEDTEHSDLELRVITKERIRTAHMSDDGYAEVILQDTAILLHFLTVDEAVARIRTVGYSWPIQVWAFLEPTVVSRGPHAETTLTQLRQAYSELTAQDFAGAVEWAFTWIWQNLGKLQDAAAQGSLCRATEAAHHLADSAAMFAALINRRYYRHSDCRYLQTAATFPYLPGAFLKHSEMLFGSKNLGSLVQAGEELWHNCATLAREHGFELQRFKGLQDIHHWLELPSTEGV